MTTNRLQAALTKVRAYLTRDINAGWPTGPSTLADSPEVAKDKNIRARAFVDSLYKECNGR